MKLIAFTGPAFSGKTTAANAIVQACDGKRISFADPIRDMLAAIGISHEQLTHDKHEPVAWLGKTPRELMQTLGTEWGRELVHPQIWLTITKLRIAAHGNATPIVIDDCRFDNEAKLVHALGGKVVRIDRRGSTPPMAHLSEAGINPALVDSTIQNSTDNREAFGDLVLSVCDAL